MQFSRSDVPAVVRDVLAATGLSASRLEIEITEFTLLQDTIRTRHDLHQLERMGARISLDDFGTAYSSLSYLHSFPFHKVKIDQSFLRGLVDDERTYYRTPQCASPVWRANTFAPTNFLPPLGRSTKHFIGEYSITRWFAKRDLTQG